MAQRNIAIAKLWPLFVVFFVPVLTFTIKDNSIRDEVLVNKKNLKSLYNIQHLSKISHSSGQTVSGFQSYKIFEGANTNERGSITVVALWSPKLNQLAKAIQSLSLIHI